MDEKKELQVRIARNKADQRKLKEEAERLEQQLKESEPTYSIGDRFKQHGYGSSDKYMLTGLSKSVFLTNLTTGELYDDSPYEVGSDVRISQREFNMISGGHGFVRYWDARKKEKC
jgi:hypothetical protein